jgi:hypothetical protein
MKKHAILFSGLVLAAFVALPVKPAAAATSAQKVPTCRTGTVAEYAGTTCSQGTVIYTFPRDFYSYSGYGIQALSADSIQIRMDPNGPYTLLIGFADWNLNAPGQSFTITLHFSVSGGDKIESWLHECEVTSGGEVSGSITVNTNPPVTSTALCNSATSRERTRDVMYRPGPVDAVVTVKASSGDGTAGLKSFGTHFKP